MNDKDIIKIQTLQAIIEYLNTQGLELNNRSQIFRFVYYKDNKKYGRDLDFMGFRFFRNKTILRKSIYMKPFFDFGKAKKRIGKYDRRVVHGIFWIFKTLNAGTNWLQ